MSSNIVLNKTHISNTSNSQLKYEFPQTVKFEEGDTVALSHLNIYMSWFNISASQYNNHHFQYKWWDSNGELTQIYDIYIDDGFYSISALNEYVLTEMYKNKTYLQSNDGQNQVYFIEFLQNEVYYSNEIRLSSLSENMDFGNQLNSYTDYARVPIGGNWIPPTNFETPEIIIPPQSNFGKLIGFKEINIFKELDDSVTTNDRYSFLNTSVPNMLPSSSYIVTCSLVNNELSLPNNVLTSFSIPNGVGFGDMISLSSDVIYSSISPGHYRHVVIDIFDQDFNRLQIKDDNILMVLSIVRNKIKTE